MTRFASALSVACLALAAGCGVSGESNVTFVTPDRMAGGLIVILPGIEGESQYNHDIRRGLVLAGINQAMPIYNWGRPVPGLGMILNQMDFVGNRLAGVRIAKLIENYQDEHPGRPVFLVGHSGGGGVAVFAAEGLSEGRQVDGLVLLSASIWAGYDLTKALGRCRSGIVNFYNPEDVGLLAIGTTVTSNVDGMRGPSAGLNGFDTAKAGAPRDKLAAYAKLYQVTVTGGGDTHTAVTKPGYVSTCVAPWVVSTSWPARAASRGSSQLAPTGQPKAVASRTQP